MNDAVKVYGDIDDAVNKHAAELHTKLFHSCMMHDGLALTNRQHALISDTLGLLEGISNGNITTGQQRIRDNLVEAISEFDPQFRQDTAMVRVRKCLSEVLQEAASHKLSIEGMPLETGKWKDRASQADGVSQVLQ